MDKQKMNVKYLTDDEIAELKIIYKDQIPYATQIYGLLSTYFKWKTKKPGNNYMKFIGLNDDWRTSGTFLMMFSVYDLVMFTLDKTGTHLYNLLINSNILKLKHRFLCYAVHDDHVPSLRRALSHQNVTNYKDVPCGLYWLPKEKASYEIDCPDEVYIKPLELNHAELICSYWPYGFDGAERYVKIFIEMNGGYGVFLKENGKLVSWMLRNHWGTMIILETVPEYKRRGYASLVTKVLAKEVASDGINPLVTIVIGNTPSEVMFEKLEFRRLAGCVYSIVNFNRVNPKI